MTKADTKRPSTTKAHRTQPYTIPSTRPAMHAGSVTPDTGGPNYNPPNTSGPHSSTPWSPASDDQLMRARQQGLNWQTIAETYFPQKTANACRKRHERLMEKRNNIGDWNGVKFEEVARAYREVREDMWRILADRVNEKWSVVESKVRVPQDPWQRPKKTYIFGHSVWREVSKISPAWAEPERTDQASSSRRTSTTRTTTVALSSTPIRATRPAPTTSIRSPQVPTARAGPLSAMFHPAVSPPLCRGLRLTCRISTKGFQPPVFPAFPPLWGPAASR